MKKLRWGILTFVGLVLCGFFAGLFWPIHYDVPHFAPRSGTAFWDLSTGSRIGYTQVKGKGPVQRSPIIFLQGGPGGMISSSNIATLGKFAEDGYDVYLYDQIGSGQSARLADITAYSPARHAQDLAEIVNRIDAEKVILIAQSWGAILASVYIAQHPDKVDRLILTGPGPIYPIQPQLATLPAPDSLGLRAAAGSNAGANASVSNFRSRWATRLARWWGIKLASDAEMDDFQTLLTDQLNLSVVCEGRYARAAEAGSGFYAHIMTMEKLDEIVDPRPVMRQCAFPVLVLKGQCDNQAWGHTQEYVQIFPNSRLVVIPNAGHAIALEQEARYLEEIRAFLRGNNKPSRQ